MKPRNQEVTYDSMSEMRNNRKSRRENEKKYKNKASRLEREWDDYDEMEYGYDEREDY